MRKLMLAVAALGVALTLAEAGPLAALAASGGSRRPTHAIGAGRRTSHYRWRRRVPTRRASRPGVRRVGVTLPQLRSELSRLETGLGAHVQRIEKAAVRPAPRPLVVAAPPAPAVPPAGLPLGPLVMAAGLAAAAAGALGFGLGRWSARRYPVPGATSAVGEPAQAEPGEHDVAARRWSRLQRQLDETQQRLSAARSRIRRLERGA